MNDNHGKCQAVVLVGRLGGGRWTMTQLVVYVFKEMRVRSEPPSETTKVDDLTSLEDCLWCASGVGCVVGALSFEHVHLFDGVYSRQRARPLSISSWRASIRYVSDAVC